MGHEKRTEAERDAVSAPGERGDGVLQGVWVEVPQQPVWQGQGGPWQPHGGHQAGGATAAGLPEAMDLAPRPAPGDQGHLVHACGAECVRACCDVEVPRPLGGW